MFVFGEGAVYVMEFVPSPNFWTIKRIKIGEEHIVKMYQYATDTACFTLRSSAYPNGI